MLRELSLPRKDGSIASYVPKGEALAVEASGPPSKRVAYAAAHVVSDPLTDVSPDSPAALDWESTLAYRQYLWSLGLSVAEAMDTAQRGMGLDWESTRELIRLTMADVEACGVSKERVACGASTDHLVLTPNPTVAQVGEAYEEQCEFVESQGGKVILMASRALAASATGAEDYAEVYGRILSGVERPVIIHWLGPMFDPQLSGYWGSEDLDTAAETLLTIIEQHSLKVEGVKISLLDAEREAQLRRRLPTGVRMFSGDDFNYPELIKGDGEHHSDALLGIFDAIAPAASSALHALDANDIQRYEELLAPTVPLSRHIFEAPTQYYKTGVVFLAYLNGHQDHFRMVGGLESARSVVHLSELFVLADEAGMIFDPELASERMRRVLSLSGVLS